MHRSSRPKRERSARSPRAFQQPSAIRNGHVHDIARQLPDGGWPERLRAAVVDAGTGELALLSRADGIPLDVGVAASCAAPGLVAPVALGGTPHVDGGARSATNADVLERFDVSRALAVTPIPKSTPMVGEATQRVLDEECRRLNDAGIDVATVVPSDLEDEIFDLGDVEGIPAVVDAGRTQGRREATRLMAWLSSRSHNS